MDIVMVSVDELNGASCFALQRCMWQDGDMSWVGQWQVARMADLRPKYEVMCLVRVQLRELSTVLSYHLELEMHSVTDACMIWTSVWAYAYAYGQFTIFPSARWIGCTIWTFFFIREIFHKVGLYDTLPTMILYHVVLIVFCDCTPYSVL